MRGKKCHGIVTPVIMQVGLAAVEIHDRKFVDWHQLHRCDAQGLQVGDFFNHTAIGSRVCHAAAFVPGEPSHMQFVDHGF